MDRPSGLDCRDQIGGWTGGIGATLDDETPGETLRAEASDQASWQSIGQNERDQVTQDDFSELKWTMWTTALVSPAVATVAAGLIVWGMQTRMVNESRAIRDAIADNRPIMLQTIMVDGQEVARRDSRAPDSGKAIIVKGTR